MKALVLAIFLILVPGMARAESCLQDTSFQFLTAGMVVSTVADVETTFAGIASGKAHEGNPILSPFVKSGRLATYGFEAVIGGGTLWIACTFMHSDDPFYHRNWAVIPLVEISGHGVAAGLNLRYIN